jgi:hypothetical protein
MRANALGGKVIAMPASPTEFDPPIGESLEETPDALRASARPIAYGSREITGLTPGEADAFARALEE